MLPLKNGEARSQETLAMDTGQEVLLQQQCEFVNRKCFLSKITDCRLASNGRASWLRRRPTPVSRPLEPRPWSAGSSQILPLSGPRQIVPIFRSAW
jgi:hypothetical protein